VRWEHHWLRTGLPLATPLAYTDRGRMKVQGRKDENGNPSQSYLIVFQNQRIKALKLFRYLDVDGLRKRLEEAGVFDGVNKASGLFGTSAAKPAGRLIFMPKLTPAFNVSDIVRTVFRLCP